MMAVLPLPRVISDFVSVAQGVESGERAVMYAELGAGGTGTAGTLVLLTSEAEARTVLGVSQGAEAAALWFRLAQLRAEVELYVYILDSTGWTANTWTLTWTGTTNQSGVRILRVGPFDVIVQLPNDADPTAQAAAANAAVNDANIPFTSSVLAGVQTLTSQHLGLAASRTPVTIDLYPQRAENGVPGSTVAIVNNADATGVPAVLDAAAKATIRSINSSYWIAAVAVGAWLDQVDDELQNGWTQLNQRTWYIQSYATPDLPTYSALVSGRNQRAISIFAQENMPEFELTAGVRLLATAIRERLVKARPNPPLTNVVIEGARPGTLLFEPPGVDPGPVIALGGMSHHGTGQAICPSFITTRIKNALLQDDFTETYVSAVLARRDLLEGVQQSLQPYIESLRIPDGEALIQGTVNETAVEGVVSSVVVDRAKKAIVFATEAQAKSAVQSVAPITTGNIVTGFNIKYDAQIVQPTVQHKATALAR